MAVTTTLSRTIAAPVETVFDTVAHIENFSKAVPHIVSVEFLSETRRGPGTRFRETRRMGKREDSHVLEVTEYAENDRVRIVADSHGTVWDTVFAVRPSGEGTELTMVMAAEAYKFLPRLINPLMKGFIAKAIAMDMDAVKNYCEAGGAA